MRRLLALALAWCLPVAAAAAPPPRPATTAVLQADRPGAKVDRHIFGQFVEHLGRGVYDGIWVGEDSPIPNVRGYRLDVVTALKALNVPVIRWPGGCFAEYYHWRDGIGPRAKRPVRLNSKWGNVEESNAFGTHEFMDFAELIGADAYVAGNIGSGSPGELADWVEYMTSASRSTLAQERRANGRDQPWRLPYVGIGNELSNCGGSMRPAYAADVYRQFQTFLRPPQPVFRIATGPYEDEFDWTETMMREAGAKMDGLAFHYYTVPGGYDHQRPAVSASEDDWADTLAQAVRMEPLIARHAAIMDKYDSQKRVALVVDEWGPMYAEAPDGPPFTFRSTLRDAIVAALTLNIFVHHADRVRFAAIAQMINAGAAMAQTDGARMVLRPSYYVFLMYRPFQDGLALPLAIHGPDYRHGGVAMPAVQGAAVRGADGAIHVALVNVDPTAPAGVALDVTGAQLGKASGEILTAARIDAQNSFDVPDAVRPMPFADFRLAGTRLTATLPPHSVTMLHLGSAR